MLSYAMYMESSTAILFCMCATTWSKYNPKSSGDIGVPLLDIHSGVKLFLAAQYLPLGKRIFSKVIYQCLSVYLNWSGLSQVTIIVDCLRWRVAAAHCSALGTKHNTLVSHNCQHTLLPLLWIDSSLSSTLLYVHLLAAAAVALTPCNSNLTVTLTIPNSEATQPLPSIIEVIY